MTHRCLPRALLLAVLPVGCGAETNDPHADAAARVRAAFALAGAADRPPTPDRPDDGGDLGEPDPNCPRCGGSGTVPSGDGLVRVPCGCRRRSSNAQEIKNQTADDRADDPRVLVFTAGWCPSCRGLKAAVGAAGAGFELIDVDADPRTAAAFGVTAVPTLVRLVDGRETGRTAGPRGVSGLRRFRAGGG